MSVPVLPEQPLRTATDPAGHALGMRELRGRWRALARRACLLALVVLLIMAVAAAPSARSGGSVAPRPALEERLDEVLAAGAPGVVALVDDGTSRRPWIDARGLADVRSGRPMGPHDRFRAGSVTKSFVATVALQLVDEGRLSLSDTVAQRLPGILPYGGHVTVRELLNHTSGVPEYALVPLVGLYRGERLRSWTPRELVELVAAKPPLFTPGTSWSYSNTDYVLAGMIIERASGHPLAREIARRILWPLRLRDTSFPVHVPWIPGPHARGYSVDFDADFNQIAGSRVDFTVQDPSWSWGAGNLISDIDDIARFYRALLGGWLLSPARLAEMEAGVPTPLGLRYGLGLEVIDTECGPLYGHDGADPGFANVSLSSADGRRQAGLMINLYFAPPATLDAFGLATNQALAEALAGLPCAEAPAAPGAGAASLGEALGAPH